MGDPERRTAPTKSLRSARDADPDAGKDRTVGDSPFTVAPEARVAMPPPMEQSPTRAELRIARRDRLRYSFRPWFRSWFAIRGWGAVRLSQPAADRLRSPSAD